MTTPMLEHREAKPAPDAVEGELRKLRKINRVLMDRVERDMDAHGGNAFSLFQTAITLEGRVSERTEELTRLTQRLMHEVSERRETENALLLAKAEAEQANLGKTRFLAAASHDLHQPLNAARLFLGALADEVVQGRPRQLVERVEAALDTVSELLDTLLDISKLDAGAWTTVPTSFPVAPLLALLADEYGPQADACGLALRVVQSGAVVHTDQTLLARVLRNLVSNAIRYTEAGRILIGCRQAGTGHVRVEVWDTGIGIPEAKRAHIFEEFQQLGAPPRRHEKGFGLGLAIVDRIARLLALEVSVRSGVGHGSCFAVRVPRGVVGAPEAENPAARAPTPGGELEGLCIACVENDAQTLQAMEALLRSWGCRPVVAPGLGAGFSALATEGCRPDLILADYHLDDGLRGTDAVAALREQFGADIPAVIVSSDRAAAVQAEAEARGCGFLVKPLRPAKLRAVMGYVLGRAGA
jgi:two-component system, sensor histidine kinase